jgi:3-phosphoshikimate 1-carboxyvinyltransferase
MSQLKVTPCKSIEADIRVPGDKSISHRSIMFGALAEGKTRVTGFLRSEDCLCTMRIFQALGVNIEEIDAHHLLIEGSAKKLKPPCEPLDCGNSGTSMRLITGVLAGQTFTSKLFGDASLSKRPMQRIITPLTQMGARILAEGEKGRPPLEIHGQLLKGIDYISPIASAQLKSSILLAGLFAKGKTSVTEPIISRDHTERMLEHFHAAPMIENRKVTISGDTRLHAQDIQVPGDISSAAFWLVAAAASPQSNLTIRDVGLNPTRTGVLSVLLRMGAQIRESIETSHAEPFGTIQVKGGHLVGTIVEGEEIPNVIDEIPILSVAAALAEGETIFRNAEELRVKETDRIAAMAGNLRQFGVEVEEFKDGMCVKGGCKLKGAHVQSFGDHRIAMSCAILGLFAEGETLIDDTDCIPTSYPTFVRDLQQISARNSGGLKKFVTIGASK